jgi:tetratricopeptide (TPR) repeat protein
MISENTIQHEIDSENIDFLALCKSNPKVGFHKSIELLKKAETHGYAKGTGEALRNLAFASQLLGLIPEGYQYARQAIKILEDQQDHKNLAHVYHTLGFILDHLGNQEERLEVNQTCLKLSRELKEEDWIIRTLNNTGDCYTKLKKYNEAIGYFKECLSLLKDDDSFMHSVVTCNLGEVYFYNNQYDEAIAQFQKSKSNAILNHSKGIEVTNTLFISRCLHKLNQNLKAIEVIRQAIDEIEKVHHASQEINFKENGGLTSPALLKVSMDIEAEVYKHYGELSEIDGNLKNALFAFKKHKEIEEKLNKEKYTQEYESIELRMEISQLENIVNERTQELEKTLSDLQLKEQNTRLVIENAIDAILFFNWDGEILDYNRKSLKYFDLESSSNETNICDILMFLADKDLGNFIRNLYKDGHNDLNNKRHRMRAIDSSLFFEVAFTKINTNGNSQGVAFISNITDKIESEKRKTRDLKTQTTINLLSQTIHDETDYYSLLNTITNHIIHEFEVAKCGIHVFDKEKDGVFELTNFKNKTIAEDFISSIGDEKFILQDDHNYSREIMKSKLSVPLRISSLLVGYMRLEHSESGFFNETHFKVLTSISSLLASRLDKIQEQKQKEILQEKLFEMNQKLEDEVFAKSKQINELTHKFHEHEKESLLADMANAISHELNTPFGIINSGASAMKDIIGDLLEIKLNSNLEPKDFSFALDFSKSHSLEQVINSREKRKKITEIRQFLESIDTNSELINEVSKNLVEASFPIQKTAALEYVLEHKNPNELLLLIKRVQQSLSFSDTISKTSSRASNVVKELTKLAKKEHNTEKVKIILSENINSIVSVYKYKLDNAQININIPENAEIIAVESKMHHLWKSMIMMACNNYKEDHEEKELSFDYSVNAQFNNVIFKFNGPQIEKYILDKNLNIGNSDDQDDLNLNLRIIRKITEDISGSFEIDSAPDNNIFTVKIPHTPAKKSLILQHSLAHKKSPTGRL